MNVVKELVSRLIHPKKFVVIASHVQNLKLGNFIFNTFTSQYRYKKLLRIQIVYRKNQQLTETEFSTAKDFEVQEVIMSTVIPHFKVNKDMNQEYRVKTDINLVIPDIYLPQDHEIRVTINKTLLDVYAKIWVIMEV